MRRATIFMTVLLTVVLVLAGMANAQGTRYIVNPAAADQGAAGTRSAKALIDAIGSKNATLVFAHSSGAATTTYTFGTDETIPSNISVIIENGARLTVAVSKVLTINSTSFSAGWDQIFDGAGIIYFGSVAHDVKLTWWGETPAAFNAAVNSLTVGGVVLLPNKTLSWAPDIAVVPATSPSRHNTVVRGTHTRSNHVSKVLRGTVLQASEAGTNLLTVKAKGVTIENVAFDGNGYVVNLLSLGELSSDTGMGDFVGRDLYFVDGERAIYAYNAVHITFENSNWYSCGNGTTTPAIEFFNGENAGTNTSDWWFTNCNFEPVGGTQFKFDGTGAGSDNANFVFTGVKIEGDSAGTAAPIFVGDLLYQVRISDSYIRSNHSSIMDADNISLCFIDDVTFLSKVTPAIDAPVGSYNHFNNITWNLTEAAADYGISFATGRENRITNHTMVDYGVPAYLGQTAQTYQNVNSHAPIEGTLSSVKLRFSQVLIDDGTNAATLKITVTNLWNGDAIAETNNVAKGATTGNYQLSAGGNYLDVNDSGLTGVPVFADMVVTANGTGTAILARSTIDGNDIRTYFTNAATGADVDLTTLVDSGVIYIRLMYLTTE